MTDPTIASPARARTGLNLSAYDDLTRALSQAEAMLLHTYGHSGETFRALSGISQDAYLWAVHEKVEEIRSAADRLKLMGGAK